MTGTLEDLTKQQLKMLCCILGYWLAIRLGDWTSKRQVIACAKEWCEDRGWEWDAAIPVEELCPTTSTSA